MDLASGAALQRSAPRSHPAIKCLRLGLGGFWIAFQIYIIFWPQSPMVERPLHLALATSILFLWMPLPTVSRRPVRIAVDSALLLGASGVGAYYLLSARRLAERMEGVDPVLSVDALFGLIAIAVLVEGVRRAVGWPLVAVIAAFVLYGFAGGWMPGWLQFSGFGLDEAVEILTLSLNGVLGITTATSVQFVFYFILFGALYTAVGGGQLVIDIGLRVAGRHSGGSAKAAVVSSSLMGSVTGKRRGQCCRHGSVHHTVDAAGRLFGRRCRRARGDRVHRRAADATRHGRGCVRNGRDVAGRLRAGGPRRPAACRRLLCGAVSRSRPAG